MESRKRDPLHLPFVDVRHDPHVDVPLPGLATNLKLLIHRSKVGFGRNVNAMSPSTGVVLTAPP